MQWQRVRRLSREPAAQFQAQATGRSALRVLTKPALCGRRAVAGRTVRTAAHHPGSGDAARARLARGRHHQSTSAAR